MFNRNGAGGRGRAPWLALGAVMLSAAAASAQSIFYVDASVAGGDGSSWARAASDLQTALSAARLASSTVREIRVAGGVYRPDSGSGDRDASFKLVSGVTLRGGYAGLGAADPDARDLLRHATVLSGDLAGDDAGLAGPRSDNSRHVVRVTGVTALTVLEGVVVIGGAADGVVAATGPVATTLGGGVLIDGGADHVVISHCRILANRAYSGGGLCSMNSGPRIQQCVFGWNTAGRGSGAYIEVTTETLPAALIVNCTFGNNPSVQAGSWGGFGDALYGARFQEFAPRAIVRQCLVAGNTSSRSVRYPVAYDGYLTLTRCQAPPAHGGLSGTNVSAGDPWFVDPLGPDGLPGTADDDFRLRPGSICDDVGESALAPQDLSDIDGDGDRAEPCPLDAQLGPRLLDDSAAPDRAGAAAPVIDLGAYEGPALGADVGVLSAVPEGQTRLVEVRLTRPPTVGAVIVQIGMTGDPTLSVSPATMTFTALNWSAPQTLTVSAAQDNDFVSGSAAISFTGIDCAPVSMVVRTIDDDAAPGVIRVKPGATGNGSGQTWTDAVPTLGQALALAAQFPSIQQLWVGAGTYRATGVSGFVVRPGLALYGGFAGNEGSVDTRPSPRMPTTVSGDVLGDDGPGFANRGDNARAVLTVPAGDGVSVFDGLTVTGAGGLAHNNGNGGGLVLEGPRSAVVKDCEFVDNLGRGAQVAFFTPDSSATVVGCRFVGNAPAEGDDASARGGGLALEAFTSSASAVVEGCEFDSNHGEQGAGLLGAVPRLAVRSCRFRENLAEPTRTGGNQSGGGAYILLGGAAANAATVASLEMTDCVFEDNQSNGSGAGVYMSGRAGVSIHGCAFRRNHATEQSGGGGLYHGATVASGNEPVTMTVDGCEFDANSATSGAGLFDGSSLLRVTNSTFRNHTGAQGGALVITTDVTACTFEDNSATEMGGAMVAQQGILNCTFRRNRAPISGAVHFVAGGWASGCLFENNRATSGAGGAAGGGRLVGCTFVGNTAATDGGAQYFGLHTANCRFIGNTAGRDGGAAWMASGSMSNCAFSMNRAVNGGAVRVATGSNSITVLGNCTFVGNHADALGGGVHAVPVDQQLVSIYNSILWQNTDSTGAGQAAQAGGLPASYLAQEYWALPTIDNAGVVAPPGGFVPGLPLEAVDSGALAIHTLPRLQTPAGWLGALPGIPGGGWQSSSTSGDTDGRSFMVVLPGLRFYSLPTRLELTLTFACVGSLGEAGVPGVYMNGIGVAGTSGIGRIDQATVLGATDLLPMLRPRTVANTQVFYVHADPSSSGLFMAMRLRSVFAPIAYSIVSGQSGASAWGNRGDDPRFASLPGPDGVLGTADDSFDLGLDSPAIDAGNSYLIDADLADADLDGQSLSRVPIDINGSARRIDFLETGAGIGHPIVDMGAVEAAPSNSVTVRCVGDMNRDGYAAIEDLFLFLQLWFARDIRADADHSGTVSLQDIFTFLQSWFAGCGN